MKTQQLPFSEPLERRVIGSMAIDEDAHATGKDALQSADFFDPKRARLFELLCAIPSGEVDPLLLSERIRTAAPHALDEWEACKLVWANHVDIEPYCSKIRTLAQARAMATAAMKIAAAAMGAADEPEIYLQQSEAEFGKAVCSGDVGVHEVLIAAAMSEAIEDMQGRLAAQGNSRKVPTGLPHLDYVMGGGLRRGSVTVVAGRPGMGKSVLGQQIALNAGLHGHALSFSLEMTNVELMERVLAAQSGIPASILSGIPDMPNESWTKLQLAAARIADKHSVGFVSGNAFYVEQIRRAARSLHRKHNGLSCIIVDYLQLVHAYGRWPSREPEIATVSRELKLLAMELDVPVVLVSQLNRQAEARADKRPLMSELRESGSIEQDADCVLLMFRADYYDRQSKEPGVCEVNVAKQRGGKTGVCKLRFEAHVTRFSTLQSWPLPTNQSASA